MMPISSTPLQQSRSQWLAIFWFLNLFLWAVIGCGYWPWLHLSLREPLPIVYAISVQIGWFGLFALAGFFISLLLVWLPKFTWRLPAMLLAFVSTSLLITDVIAYSQYRFHLSGFVFELFFTNGVITLPTQTQFEIAGIVLLLACLQWLIATASTYLQRRRTPLLLPATLVCLCALGFSQALHVWQDANYQTQIPSLTRHFPQYYPMTARVALANWGWVNLEKARHENLKLDHAERFLAYPRSPINMTPLQHPVNFLIVFVDTWRFDESNSQVMPNVAAFAKHAVRFEHHLSGGNATRTGVFSWFYGLPATYWSSFRNSGVRPVLMETLAKQGYQFEILASAPLNHPPFDRTVFANIPNLRIETPGSSATTRDQRCTDDMQKFLQSASAKQKPFFAFLFYDGAHAKETPAGAAQRFTPAWTAPNYLALNNQQDPAPYRNLYRNSLFYIDKQIGVVLNELKKQKLDRNTVVIISADHGEEFNDHHQNYWGHGSNFSDSQIHVPLYMQGPSLHAQTITWKTSHLDIAPTLMLHFLGVKNSADQYSEGFDLFSENASREWLVVGSYFNYAVVGSHEIDVVYPGGFTETLTADLHPKTQKEFSGSALSHVMNDLHRFLR